MNQTLSFLLSGEATKIFDHFTALFDIRIAYFAPDGRELAVGLDRSWCSYCGLLRTELGDDGLCVRCDRNGRESSKRAKDLVSYRCHGGLMEAVKPLYADDELIGFTMIGQVRMDEKPPAEKAARWAEAIGDGRLEEAWEQVPLVPSARLHRILPLFSSLVDLIIAKHMVAILGRHPLDTVVSRMAEHPEENLSLAEAAAMIGRSQDRTAHQFTEVYGKSFKALQRELKMKKAAELLTQLKNIGIKEVALRCGFDDPLYFSRVFREHFGIPPSKLRDGTG